MSRVVLGRVTCPSCHTEHRLKVAQSMNAGRHPAVLSELLSRTFQQFQCEQCGRPFHVDQPFTLTHLEAGYLIGVLPKALEPKWTHWEGVTEAPFARITGPSAGPIARRLAEGVRVRTVFGLEAAREKVLAFQAGLDDVILEALKLRLIKALGLPLGPASRPRLEEAEEEVLTFTVLDEGEVRSFEVSRELYEDILDEPEAWAGALGPLSEGAYVDLGRLLLPPDEEEEPPEELDPLMAFLSQGFTP